MPVDFDSGLAAVIGLVREVHAPIDQAITDRKEVAAADCAALSGAVAALLGAIDARTGAAPAKAVA